MQRNLIAAALMRHLCEHDWHGYTQGAGRWGDGDGYCPVDVDGTTYYVAQGDRDCSSAVISCWQAAGVDVQATYTGDMLAGFLATGLFEKRPLSFTAQPGDIYLNYSAHTAMCISTDPDLLGEFSINEYGGIVGGQVGDQTGYEAYVHGYYDFPWDCILHYIGDDGEDDDMAISDEDARKIALKVLTYTNKGINGDNDFYELHSTMLRKQEALDKKIDAIMKKLK